MVVTREELSETRGPWARLVAACGFVVIASAVVWESLPVPLVFCCAGAALAFFVVLVASKSRSVAVASGNLGAIALILLGFETYLQLYPIAYDVPLPVHHDPLSAAAIRSAISAAPISECPLIAAPEVKPPKESITPDDRWELLRNGTCKQWFYPAGRDSYRVDPELGKLLVPNRTMYAQAECFGRPAYSYTARIDENGLRTVPRLPGAGPRPGALFVGGSFVFGHGVEDYQTSVSLFANAAGLDGINLGQPGGGANDMLAHLRGGLADRAVGERPVRLAIYLAILDHVRRATGARMWSEHRPRFVLEHGTPVRAGNFRLTRLAHAAQRSALFGLVLRMVRGHQWSSESEEAFTLWAALTREIANEVRARYEAPTLILLWQDDSRMQEALAAQGLQYLSVSAYVSALQMPDRISLAFAGDGHPTPAGHRIVASLLLCVARARGLLAEQHSEGVP